MPPTIMVPLDGSAKGGRALAVASALANLAGATLDLVRVAVGSNDGGTDAAITRSLAEAQLLFGANEPPDRHRHTLSRTVLQGGDIVEQLIQHAVKCDALAVVMGTRAANAVGRLMVGSIADRIMRECPKPVILVPPGAEFMAGKPVVFARVLVPLDGSPLAREALEFLLRLPGAQSLTFVLVEVVSPVDAGSGVALGVELRDRRVAEAEARLVLAAMRVRERAATVEVSVIEAVDVADAVVADVRDALVEFIAMSTRGHGGLRRLALGSVAESVIRASEVPVLLLTPGTLAAM